MEIEDCKEGKVILATKKSVCDRIIDEEVDDRFETFLKESPFGIGIIYRRDFCPKIQETVIRVVTRRHRIYYSNMYCFRAEDLVEIERGE